MTEEIPEARKIVRQWVSVPGGSCDVRYGAGVIEELGPILKTAVGKPQDSALVVAEGSDEELVERLRRQLTDAGFLVKRLNCAAGPAARSMSELSKLFNGLADSGITADDLIVAIGDIDSLSLVAHAAAAWCDGVPLVSVPCDFTALVEVPCTPRALDVAGVPRAMGLRAATRYLIADPELLNFSKDDETFRYARALMAASAIAESEKSFSKLWDGAEELVSGDYELVGGMVIDTLKTRGHLVTSTALAIRQSLNYGQTFRAALHSLVGSQIDDSILLAEGMRFAARLAAGMGRFDVDDVLAQDELLNRLELGVAAVDIDPQDLIEALRHERFMRSNRFLLAIPCALGRVRMSTIDDELLQEHARAWCAFHASL